MGFNGPTNTATVFKNEAFKSITITGATDYNLFKIVGNVIITFLSAHVETALAAGITGASLQLFPTAGAAIQLTSLAGSDISSLPVDSMINKGNVAAQPLEVSDATGGFVSEQTGFIFARFVVGQQTGGIETHIRLHVGGAGASGCLHWHCVWEPKTDYGMVTAA